jgi:hypothetical protein
MKIETVVVALLLCGVSLLSSAAQKNTTGGVIDINVYPYLSDVETDSVATINVAANLPNRFSYFSLTNFSNQESSSELQDAVGFYTEQNVRWQVADESPLDLTLQLNFRSGVDNDRHRLGVRWRMNDTSALTEFFQTINLSWAVNFHLLQLDSEDAQVWQMEHSYRMTFPSLSKRLYLAGFIDHTFNQDLPAGHPQRPVVSETQLGYELMENFYAVAEYRINQYNRQDVNNIAVGLEYLIKW